MELFGIIVGMFVIDVLSGDDPCDKSRSKAIIYHEDPATGAKYADPNVLLFDCEDRGGVLEAYYKRNKEAI